LLPSWVLAQKAATNRQLPVELLVA
jgi:hypothetical protein